MEKSIALRILSRVALIIFIYILLYYSYSGLNTVPGEGDSLDYHIPMAQRIVDGDLFNFSTYNTVQSYYPSMSEVILSAFIFLNIPLNVYNIFAVVILFFVLIRLGRIFGLDNNFSIIFSITICSLGAITRWLNTQIIDIWVAVFFSMTLIFLEQNKRKVTDYAKLGLVLGLLAGSKYTGLLYSIVLLIFYFRSLVVKLTFKKIVVFLIPVFVFGASWYIRNYILKSNPFYPIDNPLFRGHLLFPDRVGNVLVRYPYEKISAFFSEYKLWVLSIFSLPFFLLLKMKLLGSLNSKITKLCLIGVFNFLLYLTFVSSFQEWIMVSVMRYAYPVFIPLILSVFMIVQLKKWEVPLAFISIMGMIFFNSFSYYPKLLFFLIPIALFAFYILNKREEKKGIF